MKTTLFTTILLTSSIFLQLASAQTPEQPTIGQADADRLVAMAQANIDELKIAELAVKKSTDPKVQRFAQMMIVDHSEGLKETRKVATAKNVTLPSGLDADHKKMDADLAQLSGVFFDKEYIKTAGLEDHTKARAALKDDMANAVDPDVKKLATKLAPVVAHHEEILKELASSIK